MKNFSNLQQISIFTQILIMMKNLSLVLLLLLTSSMFGQNNPLTTKIIEPTKTIGYFDQSFIHHLNSSKDEFFLSTFASGTTEYFGLQNTTTNRRYISRIGINALPVWTAIMHNASRLSILNVTQDFACIDNEDNFYIICKPNGAGATFVDATGTTIAFNLDYQKLIKINKDGKYLWSKDFYAINSGVSTDNNGDVYLYGNGLSVNNNPSDIIKMNGQNGNQIYSKNDFNIMGTFHFIPVFDGDNNMYIFTEPMSAEPFFSTGSINIPLNDGYNSLMIKFDSSGNPIFGKNFYPVNPPNGAYSWVNDVKFDGTDLIVMGNMVTNNGSFVGMSGTKISNFYGKDYAGIIAKIDLNGNIQWEKDLQSSQNLTLGMFTNLAVDEQKNIYSYLTLKDKLHYNSVEYSFGSSPENKVVTKWNNDGSIKYFKSVDNTGNNYQNNSYHNFIDLIQDDSFSILGYTSNNYFLNFPLNNSATPKMYIATFKGEHLETNENIKFDFKIFPNPTSDILNIEPKQTISKIEIFDLSGKLVKSESGKDKKISVSNLTKGMYLIKIYTENGVINSKFIKN